MAGRKVLSSQIKIYAIENAQSIGESCPMLNFTIKALTGTIKGSVIKHASAKMRLSIGSTKNCRITRASIPNETTPSVIDIDFAIMKNTASTYKRSFTK